MPTISSDENMKSKCCKKRVIRITPDGVKLDAHQWKCLVCKSVYTQRIRKSKKGMKHNAA